MSNDNLTQPGVRISESLWNQFRNDIRERKGVVRGHLKQELENAIESYLEASGGGDVNDRLRRLENHVEAIREDMDSFADESRKKKKDSSVSSRVENRLSKIESQIEREAGTADRVHESIINKAIEENAGSSRPTLQRYREMLKQRHIAFEVPDEGTNSWILDEETFITLTNYNWSERTDELVEIYGEDWLDTKIDEYIQEETERGIQ